MKYFSPQRKIISKRERIEAFFRLIVATEADIFTAEEATEFLATLFALVEDDAYEHNRFFPRNTISERMKFFWELDHWGRIPGMEIQTYYACGDTRFCFFVGETGGLEIHKLQKGIHPVRKPLFYRDKKDNTDVILIRPGTILQDAWGRPREKTIELFTTYKKDT
jgi:hypothetical protein